MTCNGQPVRWNFLGSTGSTSQSINIYLPGSNTLYNFQANDWMYFTSFEESVISGVVTAPWYILSAPAGQTTITASTVLLTGGCAADGAHYWTDSSNSEAISGPQGILPSILFTSSTGTALFTCVTGTGYIVHGPGYQTPNTQVNAGQAWNPLPTFTVNVPPSTGAQS